MSTTPDAELWMPQVDHFVALLNRLGITVRRPDAIDHAVGAKTPDWEIAGVVDERTAVLEAAETPMIELMRSLGCEVIPCPLDRVYAFGGGFHCCTVDIRREGTLRSYFPSLDEALQVGET